MRNVLIGTALLVGFIGLLYGLTAIDHYIHTQMGFGWAFAATCCLAIPAGIKAISVS